MVLGVIALALGLFGYLVGDLQVPNLSWMADQVYIAREAAQDTGTAVSGCFDLEGDDSGVRIFAASVASVYHKYLIIVYVKIQTAKYFL